MYHLLEERAMACMSTSSEKDQYTDWEMRYRSQKRKKEPHLGEKRWNKADINSYSNSIIKQN